MDKWFKIKLRFPHTYNYCIISKASFDDLKLNKRLFKFTDEQIQFLEDFTPVSIAPNNIIKSLVIVYMVYM
jgi:hypothetical protein